jgi:Tfp pilus assembly protein PilN
MIEINLLPKELQWKRFRLTLDKNILYILAIGIVITLVMAGYSYIFQVGSIAELKKEINDARQEESRYTAEIRKIDEIAEKKTQILARMSAIQLLDPAGAHSGTTCTASRCSARSCSIDHRRVFVFVECSGYIPCQA